MTDEAHIWELVQEVLDTDKLPEEVCAGCPELLWEVQKRWKQARHIDSRLEALFPSSDSALPQPAIDRRQFLVDGQLPTIPGYEVDEVLGHGGMGVVYKAKHVKLNRPVALKMMLYGACATSSEQARFQREAEAVAALHHPHIVQIYDVGETEERPYYTMEFLEGGSLAKKLAGKPQPAAAAASYSHTLAQAVQAAHNTGIVHRDLKPANVLLTSDGTLKIGDFGLARRVDADQSLTLTMAKVGTPSYMAPEQALGKANAFCPAVDIYSLGALLYEMLTGRPPFRAATAAETQRQLIAEEPAPPSRLNANVPRDLETICLKCLHKEPTRRYESALALADDLRRFEEGRPIQARPVGRGERAWRWCRRNPTMAALLLTALALVGLASGGGTWLLQQRTRHNAELRSDVSTAVTQATSLGEGFHFNEARALLEQAWQRLEPAGPDDLRRQVEQERAHLELAENLDEARLRAASPVEGRFETAGAESWYADSLYEQTLTKAGLGGPGDDSKAAAARVRGSARRAEIIAALDDWASITADPARRAWLLAVARGADPDPARDRLRQPKLWDDGPRLTKLVNELGVEGLSPQLATALGRVLLKTGGEAVPLLSAAQAHDPRDFWLNFELGWALYVSRRSDEALGFYRAALALRPEASAAHNGVGVTLRALGRWDEAIGHYKQALEIDPNFAMVHNNLGLALWAKGRQDEAISHYQEAIRLDPKVAASHNNLGLALWAKGRQDEAISHYQEAIRLDPKVAASHNNLGLALWAKGRQDEAISHYQEAIRLDPKVAASHYDLGLALRDKGRLDEAIDHLRQATEIEPTSTMAPPALASTLFLAARADVRAAADRGATAGQLSESERAERCRHALDRLRGSLERKTQLLQDGKLVDLSLTAWQTDPAFAGVRDPAELAKLPDAEREKWRQFWADVAQQIAADPLSQGRAHAARREWVKAADGYARALTRGPTDDSHFCFEHAALLLLSGDRAGYATACRELIERSGEPGGPRAYHVARAGTLAADGAPDASLLGRLADNELKQNATQFWSLTEQGALAYRAARFEESLSLFEQSLRADAHPGRAVVNWVWLALAKQRVGKTEEARRWLEKAQNWLDQYRDGIPPNAEAEFGLHLHNWLEANVLRREAEALILPQ